MVKMVRPTKHFKFTCTSATIYPDYIRRVEYCIRQHKDGCEVDGEVWFHPCLANNCLTLLKDGERVRKKMVGRDSRRKLTGTPGKRGSGRSRPFTVRVTTDKTTVILKSVVLLDLPTIKGDRFCPETGVPICIRKVLCEEKKYTAETKLPRESRKERGKRH